MSTNRDVWHLYSTTRSCILFQEVHSKIESHRQCRVMKLLYLVRDDHMADNNRDDKMNRLVHYCREFLSLNRHIGMSVKEIIRLLIGFYWKFIQ